MLITDEYRELNKKLHAKGNYGISGHKHAQTVSMLANDHGCSSIIDYGCGAGTLKAALSNDDRVVEYDPAIPGKDVLPSPADLVVCTDVLEHIEPECLDDVLKSIEALSKKRTFLVIATRPAKKILEDGRNAHLIQENVGWWLPKLRQYWDVINFFGNDAEFQVILKPKWQLTANS